MRYGFRFVFLEGRNFLGGCRRSGFGLRLGFFFPQAFFGIDGFAIGNDWLWRHGDPRGWADGFYVDAAASPSDVATLRPCQVEIDRDGDTKHKEVVKNKRVEEKC